MPTQELDRFADRIRLRSVKMVAPHGMGYLGQALSSAEIFASLFAGPYDRSRDKLVCSPGHYIIAFFAAAAEMGLVSDDELSTYGAEDSVFEAIGTERSPVVDLTCGSLGQGLSGGVGFAVSAQLRGDVEARVFVLVSDGELEEGQTWEAAMFAAHRGLGNLIVLLDANDSQVDGPVSSITTVEPIAAKWESFGWAAFDVDGHDTRALGDALRMAVAESRPSIVIARTSTAHGLACLPSGADGHFIKLPPELVTEALAELEARLA
ncbi:MAG TPA: 1-deoxy-D-xylulose-5-phosphate synthase N-terminal domain-containing protein [Acidimicrobiales bacterium]